MFYDIVIQIINKYTKMFLFHSSRFPISSYWVKSFPEKEGVELRIARHTLCVSLMASARPCYLFTKVIADNHLHPYLRKLVWTIDLSEMHSKEAKSGSKKFHISAKKIC